MAPIMDIESAETVGGIYLAPGGAPGGAADLSSAVLPATQSLAAQISSALHSANAYAQTLAHQRVEQELALAGQIQADFLPRDLPHIPGWQLAATLQPARETSGDFYDVIPLPNGRFGIVIADVSDKGMGAALYMALSRTLIRTYAMQYHMRPDLALGVANRRMLMDTQVGMFVTVFYGILDPVTGMLTYCNAGHNPPYLLSAQDGDAVKALDGTGTALGVFKGQDLTWGQEAVQLAPGDMLVFYSDGVTDAQDAHETFFGEERLLQAVRANSGRSAQEVREALIAEVHEFMGDAPQFDDITLLVAVREGSYQ
jgi:sigma-B regulation protein RsbU (phosphoserine phosphatase)